MGIRSRWKRNYSDLRKLIRELTAPSDVMPDMLVQGQFGVKYNPRYKFYQVYNSGNDTVIATIKFGRAPVVIRYRKSSWYSSIFSDKKKCLHAGLGTIIIPSTSLHRHKAYARTGLVSTIERELIRRRGEPQEVPVDGYYVVNGDLVSATEAAMREANITLASSPTMRNMSANDYIRDARNEFRQFAGNYPELSDATSFWTDDL